MWEDFAVDLAREMRAMEEAVAAKLKREQLGELFEGIEAPKKEEANANG